MAARRVDRMELKSSRAIIAAFVAVSGWAVTGCLDLDDPAADSLDEGVQEQGLTVACNSGGVANPFGTHAQAYAGGILPTNQSQSQLDAKTKTFYNSWKAAYVKQGCGSGRYYVKTFMDDSLTVSEAHGYGMLVTAFMAGHDASAKTVFDGMYHYFKDHQSAETPYLMAWSQASNCSNNQGPDSATDGDLDIAYALLLADKQWGSSGAINYLAEAKHVINAIKANETTSSWYVNLGDWTGTTGSYGTSTRTSDFMPGHFASFAAATGSSTWTSINNHSYDIVSTLQANHAPSTGLLPDFVKTAKTDPRPASPNFLEGANDGKYSYNACRDPLRIAVHYLTTGDARARTAVQKMNSWIKIKTSNNPENIKAGYGLNGTAVSGSGYLTMAFAAPFAVSAMVDGSNQSWLNSLWSTVSGYASEDYYEDSIKMMAMIALSGNWWAPEDPPCN
jgi:endoglucanase